MPLKLIGDDDIHNITSGQVITELKSVVKELLENSLDADSTTIQITFKRFGLEGVEITDNGNGIEEADFETLCLKNYTSKLETFDDLGNVKTLGFRGEALNSICSVSDVTITTAISSNVPKGWELIYDKSGKLISKKLVNQSKGTVVKVANIFHNLPVRKLNLEKHYKREFQNCINMLTTYLLILTNYRIIINNIDATGRKKLILKTSGNEKIKDNLINVFGSTGLLGLESFDETFEINDTEINISGLISKVSIGDGRLTKDRQFVYINRRPTVFKRFNKIINECYKKFNSLQKPVFILNIKIDESLIDVNVTPDKGIILISTRHENSLLEMLDSKLEEFWESGGTMSIPVDSYASQNVIYQRSSGMRQVTLESFSLSEEFAIEQVNSDEILISPEDIDKSLLTDPNAKETDDDVDELLEDVSLENHLGNKHLETKIPTSSSYIDEDIVLAQNAMETVSDPSLNMDVMTPDPVQVPPETNFDIDVEFANDNSHMKSLFEPEDPPDIDEDLILPKQPSISPNQSSEFSTHNVKVRIHRDDLHSVTYDGYSNNFAAKVNKLEERNFLDKELSERLLGLSIHKNDFKNMKIVGQFNKGFIIVFKKDTDDMLIVDQHASDEKFNFERLIDETTFESQPLITPQKLDLSSTEKLTIISHIDKFTKNGFKFELKSLEDSLDETTGTEDLYLTTLPYSKNTIFNTDDLNELIQLVEESNCNSSSIPRPSKVRSMFAMRACRSSIMVGQTLSESKMEEVVQNLSTLDKPWNCPHGRPTMRHIVNIDQWTPFNADYVL
ncbi:hypothetical protein CANINC_001276 [Pichia inconspicua]|uniref:DNA mismatch repair protein MutL n=1 Tax=Pichia inconspicua TaxID=52247 RepID=A0A4T0X5M7_9ASCO|nr:hypothetical protein CANINC_001276 [[Candida] inconspicua]